MPRIDVGRYKNPENVGWAGWISPPYDDGFKVPAWMIFIKLDGTLKTMVRDNETDTLY